MINCECGGEIVPVKKNSFPVPFAYCIKCNKDWGIFQDIPKWDYMSSYSGYKINIPNFNVEGIPWRDIAHQLSMVPRFSGSVRKHYSVGQHSLLVSHYINQKYALRGLVHDCTDMIFGDLAGPLKHHSVMKEFYALEKHVQDKFYIMFKLSIKAMMSQEEIFELKKWDLAVQCAEARDLTCLTWWKDLPEHKLITEQIVPMEPDYIEHLFLQRLRELTKEQK